MRQNTPCILSDTNFGGRIKPKDGKQLQKQAGADVVQFYGRRAKTIRDMDGQTSLGRIKEEPKESSSPELSEDREEVKLGWSMSLPYSYLGRRPAIKASFLSYSEAAGNAEKRTASKDAAVSDELLNERQEAAADGSLPSEAGHGSLLLQAPSISKFKAAAPNQ